MTRSLFEIKRIRLSSMSHIGLARFKIVVHPSSIMSYIASATPLSRVYIYILALMEFMFFLILTRDLFEKTNLIVVDIDFESR